MILDGKKFTRAKDGTLVAEISDLQLKSAPPRTITLNNVPKEGQGRSFTFVGTDESEGDIAGWRFEEMAGPNKGWSWENGHPPKAVPPLRVLIIND